MTEKKSYQNKFQKTAAMLLTGERAIIDGVCGHVCHPEHLHCTAEKSDQLMQKLNYTTCVPHS